MAFRIKRDERVDNAVRRIAREQVDKAIAEIDDADLDSHKTVHQVRKRCKKIRGVLRLVRGPLPGKVYARENAWYRDSARALSHLRDAHTMVITFDHLRDRFPDEFHRVGFMEPYFQLVEHRDNTVAGDDVLRDRLDAFRGRMLEGRERIESWPIRAQGFDAVTDGLGKSYTRGRSAMRKALKKPQDERFHEWRKRTKYHWYHTRLLRPVWDDPIDARADEIKALSDLLGDDHDLAVLHAKMSANPDQFGGELVVHRLKELIDVRQSELRDEARSLGGRIFAEKKKALVARMEVYWDVWRREAA